MVSAKKFDSLGTWPCSEKLRQKYTLKEGRNVLVPSCPVHTGTTEWEYPSLKLEWINYSSASHVRSDPRQGIGYQLIFISWLAFE